jgi:Tfp pilus assembly protein PilW
MSRALDLSQRQIRAICEGARKAGFVPEIVVGKTVVRLIPDIPTDSPRGAGRLDEEEDIRL